MYLRRKVFSMANDYDYLSEIEERAFCEGYQQRMFDEAEEEKDYKTGKKLAIGGGALAGTALAGGVGLNMAKNRLNNTSGRVNDLIDKSVNHYREQRNLIGLKRDSLMDKWRSNPDNHKIRGKIKEQIKSLDNRYDLALDAKKNRLAKLYKIEDKLNRKSSKLCNYKVAAGIAGGLGAGLAGYGAYKMYKNKKKDNNEE